MAVQQRPSVLAVKILSTDIDGRRSRYDFLETVTSADWTEPTADIEDY